MRILTVGPSPFLLARNGRIHKDIIAAVSKAGHHVEAAVWHHDVQYFLPTETGKHFFETTALHPFLGRKGELPPFVFEMMKLVQPSVVISIGDYEETDWLWSLKALYPHLFKWIAVIPTGTNVINEKNRMALSYADRIVTTTKTALQAFKSVKTTAEYVPYGPDHATFYPLNKPLPNQLTVLNMGKNAQMSNVPAFLRALSETDCLGTLHTNIDDGGEYDVRVLSKRYGLGDKLTLPVKYVSVREGLGNSLVNELYNSHHAIVDCSLQSATALTLLEAMSTGCIPVGMDFGATGEVLATMPKEYRLLIPHETLLGPKEEELAVISVKELARSIQNIHRSCLSDPDWVDEARRAATKASRIFSKEKFATRISEMLETVVTSENCIAVDSF